MCLGGLCESGRVLTEREGEWKDAGWIDKHGWTAGNCMDGWMNESEEMRGEEK